MRTSHSINGVVCILLLATCATSLDAQQLTPVQLYQGKNRSLELVQQNKPDSALALLRRIAPLDSADANLWRRYGRVARQLGHWDEAVRAFQRAYDMGAFNRGITALEIANTYAAAGQPTNALNWLERAAANRLQYPGRMADDTAFVALRDSARFVALYPRANAATLSRDEKWRRDIDFFMREAQRMHVHPERPAYSQAFIDTIAALKARVQTSSDMSVKLGLRRAVAMLRDGHSGMAPDSAMRMLPIDVYLFSDGVYVVNGISDASKHVGSKVVAFGRKGINEVARAAAAYITRDNDSDLRARLPSALANTAILTEIGAANADGTVDVTLEDQSGKRSVERMRGGPLRRPLGLAAPTHGTKPFYLDRSRFYWTRELPEARALYLNFNAVAEMDTLRLPAFSRRLADQLRNPSYKNLIVDVRLNGGGNTFLLPPLIQAIATFAATDTTRRVYVITSRHTYSAAQNFTSKLEWLLNPIFVGEPTGSAPNFTGEGTGTVLPYSGIQMGISNRMHMNSDWEDQRVWIAPHIPVPLTSADFFAGRDPTLQAIIAVANATRPVM
jgi:tetratricopeptide (TPR) repeat protein